MYTDLDSGFNWFSKATVKAQEKGFCFVLLLCHAACGILVPQSAIKSMPTTLEVQSLNHWTTRQVPKEGFLCEYVQEGIAAKRFLAVASSKSPVFGRHWIKSLQIHVN